MAITDHLAPTGIFIDLSESTKDAVLQRLSAEAAQRLQRPVEDVLEAVEARERLGSTALGRGVALPHARLEGDHPPLVLFARLRRPVEFDARDEEPVDLVILVIWPESAPDGFLPTLADTCRSLRQAQHLRKLRAARTAEEVLALLASGDAAGTA
ncbi:PTS transporter subunit EIIA [Roseomonas stagni]|uniref:PTS transporter subunit EIIA n=1 Tax=Falsiroseomonas algicola TaxID=2716930 RepID=A0A6M1LJM2_9PROT|nr:PTS sugar transporter subunit IIA [Falsiroseomonas algicola]NGM20084.1 PTS transporter subunit EIIA [Falsiroseomonas algicola]